MIRGIYTAASGMVTNFKRQLIMANNLANVSTTGYKQDLTDYAEFSNMLIRSQAGPRRGLASLDGIGVLGTGTGLGETLLDLSQGDLTETGNPLDLAIDGPGFFAVQTPTGTLYTRDGTFLRDGSGYLSRPDGGLVLGENGPIHLGEGDVLVDGGGTVSVNGQVAGRIRIVDFDPEEGLLKLGDNYIAPQNENAPERPAADAVVNQGFLERSNVDLTRAMSDIMAAMRSYEASQRMLALQDQTLDRAVNDIGKV